MLSSARLFTSLYTNEFRTVCVRLRRSGVAANDIEDVAHDAFLTAYRLLPGCERVDLLRLWLFRIVHYTVLEGRRKRRQFPELLDDEPEQVDHAAPLDVALDGARAREAVARAMGEM